MVNTFMAKDVSSSTFRARNYSPLVERIRNGRHDTPLLGDIASEIGASFGTVFKRIDCSPEHGVNLLSQVDVFAAEPHGRIIRADSMSKPERHKIRRFQVLVSAAGQIGDTTLFGRSIIADARLEGMYVGPDSIAVQFADEGCTDNLYTYAFLSSPMGVELVRSCAYGTSIPRVRLDLLKQLPVPMPSDGTKKKIADLITTAMNARQSYSKLLQQAREPIERLPEMREAGELASNRSCHTVVWNGELRTLNALYYAYSGGALELLHNHWKTRLHDVLSKRGLFNGPRFPRVNCEAPHGIPFMSQRDVMLIRPVPRRIVHPGFKDHLLFVPDGSMLVGGHGTLGEGEIFGRVVFVSGDLCESGFTQDLLRIQPQKEFCELAFAFLSTNVGFRLLRSTGVGTKLLTMRPDLLADLPFPELTLGELKKVKTRVRQSAKARQLAADAESEAMAIIDSEVASQWHG